MKRHLVLLVAVALSVSGCATTTTWSRPDTSDAQYNDDRQACERTATDAHPVRMAPIGAGVRAPPETICNTQDGRTSCTTKRGTYIPPPVVDSNIAERTKAVEVCLRSRGYTPSS
jgi:hypothetical protein